MIATCSGLVAFAAALVLGWAAGNEASEILKRAILALAACWLVGWIVGAVAQRAVQDRIDEYKRQNPIALDEPPSEAPADASDPSDDQAGPRAASPSRGA